MNLQAIFENYRRILADHYFDMAGRVGRSEFWYFVLANIAVALLLSIIQMATFLPLAAIYKLAMLLPSAGMGARRLQDTGRNGALVWILILAAAGSQIILLLALTGAMVGGFAFFFLFGALIGVFNLTAAVIAIALIYFWGLPGDPGPNIYGLVPPVFRPAP